MVGIDVLEDDYLSRMVLCSGGLTKTTPTLQGGRFLLRSAVGRF